MTQYQYLRLQGNKTWGLKNSLIILTS